MKNLELTLNQLKKELIQKVSNVVKVEEQKPVHRVRFANLEVDKFHKQDNEFISFEADGVEILEKVLSKSKVHGTLIKCFCFELPTKKQVLCVQLEDIFEDLTR